MTIICDLPHPEQAELWQDVLALLFGLFFSFVPQPFIKSRWRILCSGLRFLKRSEEHTSELQSRLHLVCRLLLEKKKKKVQARQFHPDLLARLHPARTDCRADAQ